MCVTDGKWVSAITHALVAMELTDAAESSRQRQPGRRDDVVVPQVQLVYAKGAWPAMVAKA